MTIEFIPIQEYTLLFHNILWIFVAASVIQMQTLQLGSYANIAFMRCTGPLLLLFTLLYIGLRPIHAIFVDMTTYAATFHNYKYGIMPTIIKDPVFHYFTLACSKIIGVDSFFFLCATLYIAPLYIACKKWFGEYWPYALLFIIGSLSFWSYGVNGIRNGIAASLFILALSRETRTFQILWIVLAIGFHKSMMLPALGFLLTQTYNNPKWYSAFWVACIFASLFGGGFWANLIANIGLEDNRISFFTDSMGSGKFSKAGFRWDFLMYSATAICAGWYYIAIKKFDDKFYLQIFNTYIFANAFWLLVIRANYSNRFAYLSWFMIALIIIYPLLTNNIIKNQHRIVGLILVAYFSFTYYMVLQLK